MDLENIITQLREMIANKLDTNLKFEDVNPDVSLFEDGLGIDSVLFVALITNIEEKFGFQFLPEELDLDQFSNLTSVARLISAKVNQ